MGSNERVQLCCKCAQAWVGEPTSSCPFCQVNAIRVKHDNLARALFQIRSLTMRGHDNSQIALIACKAVIHIDETPLLNLDKS